MLRRMGQLHILLGIMVNGEITITKTIGDVMSEQLRGSSDHRNLESNDGILKGMLKKEFFDEKDECLEIVNGVAVYGKCDIRKFPYCHGDRPNICFNRINRQDKFWPDKNPYYYIDYNRIHCYPDRGNNLDFTCSSCSPGRWCIPEGRCILDEARYNCWSNPVADD
ncbi:hypothetical protein HJC23_009508 [Cyclotella cryptica]|uniref:Uncharacterized protein n=1 Tax=Cyclotella cryptica TaxID=29204 RepID=A0ABD3Q4Z9_9STRA|eukprot:CCRYP_008821-RA/>CCRYP_008821-RA protein AED:0.26 eAED:0.26 QI:248/1/1/1/1/1/2/963/165